MRSDFRWPFAFSLVLASNLGLAQGLDEQQMKLIQQTASAICDTVKSAKGTKTSVEIQGNVEAKLKGAAKLLAGLGASAKGTFRESSFDGLTQDATATAMTDDRGCRERIFNKMFDKIEKPVDKRTAYRNSGFRNDLRIVQDFHRTAPITIHRLGDKYLCAGTDEDRHTREVRFVNQSLSVTNYERSSTERCKEPGYGWWREDNSVCTAEMASLDDAIAVTSLPSITIYCLSGNCIRCDIESQGLGRNQGIATKTDSYAINSMRIFVGGEDYVREGLHNSGLIRVA